MQRGTGARGLRAIMERALMDVFFVVPELHDVNAVVLDLEGIKGNAKPLLLTGGTTLASFLAAHPTGEVDRAAASAAAAATAGGALGGSPSSPAHVEDDVEDEEDVVLGSSVSL